jgi:hypothetical protein
MPEARDWSEECALFYDGKGGATLRGIVRSLTTPTNDDQEFDTLSRRHAMVRESRASSEEGEGMIHSGCLN